MKRRMVLFLAAVLSLCAVTVGWAGTAHAGAATEVVRTKQTAPFELIKKPASPETNKKIDDHYRHYPIQAWRLGDQVTWVALGGEVVVDYSLRLKKDLKGDRAVWVTGYANDVMAYVGSARVLEEGGYEAESSVPYYGLPSKWSLEVEEKIVAKVKDLVKGLK